MVHRFTGGTGDSSYGNSKPMRRRLSKYHFKVQSRETSGQGMSSSDESFTDEEDSGTEGEEEEKRRMAARKIEWEVKPLQYINADTGREEPMKAIRSAGCALLGDVLHIFGGSGIDRIVNDYFQFDTETEVLQRCHTSSSARWGHAMVAVDESSFIVFGGKLQNGFTCNELLMYDADDNSWSTLKVDNPPPPMWCSTLTKIGPGRFLLYGGQKEAESPSNLSTEMYILDLDEMSWTAHPIRDEQARESHAAVFAEYPDNGFGSVYIIHGCDKSGDTVPSMLRVDLASMQVELISSNNPSFKQQGMCAAIVDREIFVIGGEVENTPLAARREICSVSVYNVDDNSWLSTTNCTLNVGDQEAERMLAGGAWQAVAVQDGKLYITGGFRWVPHPAEDERQQYCLVDNLMFHVNIKRTVPSLVRLCSRSIAEAYLDHTEMEEVIESLPSDLKLGVDTQIKKRALRRRNIQLLNQVREEEEATEENMDQILGYVLASCVLKRRIL
ncbi:hypothetical protein PROFUN_08669 [Planoprotostelium fungivorum]|uniref:Attractin/MKLN-like beta-propeller domain-containing protein n=1 Tax=Planoprotostelium fungivorum TaxID=1890364 RepID=A0A2P6NJ51_9EUKA|nr:hypothetical protein PROFUN_08669 [Planoprotostelium fungivorum]